MMPGIELAIALLGSAFAHFGVNAGETPSNSENRKGQLTNPSHYDSYVDGNIRYIDVNWGGRYQLAQTEEPKHKDGGDHATPANGEFTSDEPGNPDQGEQGQGKRGGNLFGDLFGNLMKAGLKSIAKKTDTEDPRIRDAQKRAQGLQGRKEELDRKCGLLSTQVSVVNSVIRDVNTKADEAEKLRKETDELLEQINSEMAQVAEDDGSELPWVSPSDQTEPVRKRAADLADKLSQKFNLPDREDSAREDFGPYPKRREVEHARNYSRYVENVVSSYSGKAKEHGEAYLRSGRKALDNAADSYKSGEMSEGDAWLDVGLKILDLALSFTPGIGWGKDVYEGITGKNALTGEQLTPLERSFAILGIVSAGTIPLLGKVGKMLDASETATEATRLASTAVDAAKGPTRNIVVTAGQAQAKYKHAGDFGVRGNYNKENGDKFADAIRTHVGAESTTVSQGTYRWKTRGYHYHDENAELWVFKDENGFFVSGWKLSDRQKKSLKEQNNVY